MSGKIASTRRLVSLCLAATFFLIAQAAHAAGPTIGGEPRKWIPVDKYYYFQPTLANKGGASVRFEVRNKPSWLAFDTRSGSLRGNTTSSHVGRYKNVTITAIVGGTRVSLPSFNITVTPANKAPTIAGSPAKSATIGARYAFQPIAKDPNGDKLSFTIQGKPAWMSFDATTGLLQGTPLAGNAGTTGGIVISVSDGKDRASLQAFTISIAKTNSAPVIAGSPASQIRIGETFSFRPQASDADGDKLTFSIQNLPAWASFDAATGTMHGIPEAVGSHSGIVVSVSDGLVSRALAPFTLTIEPVVARSAALTWERPTHATDGSVLTNLAGYRVHYGTHSGNLDEVIELPGAGTSSVSIEDLQAGVYYFAVRAYTTDGAESEFSEVVSKIVM